jgi:hypothetical protein
MVVEVVGNVVVVVVLADVFTLPLAVAALLAPPPQAHMLAAKYRPAMQKPLRLR